jgi:hypothetical protein
MVFGSLKIITVFVEIYSDKFSGCSPWKYSSNISISLLDLIHIAAEDVRSLAAEA